MLKEILGKNGTGNNGIDKNDTNEKLGKNDISVNLLVMVSGD